MLVSPVGLAASPEPGGEAAKKKAQSYLNLAADLMKSSAYDDALAELQRAQALSDTALVQNHLAVCLEALQRTGEAQAAYTRYLTLEDEAPGATERQKKARAAIARLAAAQPPPAPPPVPPPAPGAPVPVEVSAQPSGAPAGGFGATQPGPSAPLALVTVEFASGNDRSVELTNDEPVLAQLGCRGSGCSAPILLVAPWPTEGILVEESQYLEAARGIGGAVAAQVTSRLQGSATFARVEPGTECPAAYPAVKLQGHVVSLIHFRGKFTATAAVRVVDCASGDVLTSADVRGTARDIREITEVLARDIAELRGPSCTTPCRMRVSQGTRIFTAEGSQTGLGVTGTGASYDVYFGKKFRAGLFMGIGAMAIGGASTIVGVNFALGGSEIPAVLLVAVGGTILLGGFFGGFLPYWLTGKLRIEPARSAARLLPELEFVAVGAAPLPGGGMAGLTFRF